MFDEYIYHGKEKLRCGYTTGSCAAAASKAAAEMLLTGESVHETQLMTPKGIELHLSTENAEISEACASCAVRKDSGDDPDITNGILVYAKAEKIPFGIEIDGVKQGVVKVANPSPQTIELDLASFEVLKDGKTHQIRLAEVSA